MQDHQTTKRATKRFSVAEANAMLPLVRSIVVDICEIFKRVTGRRSDLNRIRRGSKKAGSQYEDEVAESRADLQEEYEQIWQYREELESLGVLLRGPEDGVIEFPALINGRDCFLCWQLGDDAIHYYREAASPHAPKRPLPDLEPSS